eukprot:COSAG06_NODE_4140_length_4533_cov_3.136446_6_plen_107_part_00
MNGWVNMGLEAGLQVKLDAWKKYKIPSFYGDLPTCESGQKGGIFKRGHGTLCDDWEDSLEKLVKTQVRPNFGKDKALRGGAPTTNRTEHFVCVGLRVRRLCDSVLR